MLWAGWPRELRWRSAAVRTIAGPMRMIRFGARRTVILKATSFKAIIKLPPDYCELPLSGLSCRL